LAEAGARLTNEDVIDTIRGFVSAQYGVPIEKVTKESPLDPDL
jgi:hypothetical protein